MKLLLAHALFALLAICLLFSTQPASAGDEVVKKGTAEENGLPRYMTEAEKLIPFDKPDRGDFILRAPPTGAVYCPAEYELNEGLFFAWEGYTSLLTQMIVEMTTRDNEAMAYVVVDNASEQTSANNTLTSAGADMSQVEFIVRTTDTVWIRDYGPRFIFEDNQRAVIDHTYNRPRPNDNLLNDYICTLWSIPQYDIPLTHGGGNFHLFSNGDAFMSSLILAENPGLTEQDVIDLYADYQNVNLTIYTGFPSSFDSTRHIDMWMLPVGDYKVIIGEYAPATGQPYTITENAAADMTARGYTVYRTPGWSAGGTHYTYTNCVIINDIVFMSTFSSYPTQNAQALAVFQAAMPDHTIIPVDCSSIITAAGAVHCIVMHVPAENMSMSVSPSADFAAEGDPGGPFTPASMVYTVYNQAEIPIDYEVICDANWVTLLNSIGTIPAAGSAEVTAQIDEDADSLPIGLYESQLQFVNTTDHSGDTVRDVSLQVGVPEVVYTWDMDENPGWSISGGLWAFGQPAGGGGQYGNPDPTSGYTGFNVYGYNLNGDYESSMPERHLTTTAIDCTDLTQVTLSFQRWLGVEEPVYDHAYVRVSTNGSTWTTVWQNTATIDGGSWVREEFDISELADNQPTVYVRWTMGTTDSAWQYCGWNIDDVEILALSPQEPACPWDIDGNQQINPVDSGLVMSYFGCTVGGGDPACDVCDIDGNGEVNPIDSGLVMSNFGPCP